MPENPESSSNSSVRLLLHSGLISVMATLILVHDGSLSAAQEADIIMLPFVWRDAALVCLTCAAPLAWIFSGLVLRSLRRVQYRRSICCIAAAMLCAIAWELCFRTQEISAPSVAFCAFPGMVRSFTSLCMMLGMTLMYRSVKDFRSEQRREDWQTNILRVLCSLTVLALVPTVYVDARSRHDVEQYVSLRQQSRLGEANSLLKRILLLDPLIRNDGLLLRREQSELQQQVELLTQQTLAKTAATVSFDQQLLRARQLAMLGRTKEAVSLLLEASATCDSVEACSLLGTMLENRCEWNSALEFYGIADTLLKSLPEELQSSAEATQIAMGSAYCCRRLGRWKDARVQYLRLLELNPDANTHFLLAQFFEDTQETHLARKHALTAMQLDPKRYTERVLNLIRKMQSLHFRCLSL